MVVMVLQAAMRGLHVPGGSHIFSFTEWGLLWIVMAASPWLVREKGHVYIELLTAAVPRPIAPTVSRAVSLLCVVICLILVWYTWEATACLLVSRALGAASPDEAAVPTAAGGRPPTTREGEALPVANTAPQDPRA